MGIRWLGSGDCDCILWTEYMYTKLHSLSVDILQEMMSSYFMMFKVTLLSVYMLYELSSLVSSCELRMYLRNRLMGFGCARNKQVTFTDVAGHECVLRCMLHKSCTAVNYYAEEKICVRFEVPCPILEMHQHVHYQILAPTHLEGCINWVNTHDWDYPRMVKYNHTVNGLKPHGVARLMMAGEILPAKRPRTNQVAITVQGNARVSKDIFEFWVVNETCSLLWMDYDASSGNCLPAGAVVGGRLADETPLYVAAVNVSASQHVIGYYNHVTRVATCVYAQVTKSQIMKILTVP